jgi:two-component system response regulator GlrR
MEERISQAHSAARSDGNVLITGAIGTGKHMLARAMHRAGPRRAGPLIVFDCVAVRVANVISVDVEAGPTSQDIALDPAFAGAKGGSILLEEVVDLPTASQADLMRLLDIHAPAGARSDAVRVLSISSRDVSGAVTRGQFREDLLYRLASVQIDLPTLSRRREDIPLLVAHFLDTIAAGGDRKIFAPEAIELLMSADWPGNVQQLESTVRQAASLARGPVISVDLVEGALGGGHRVPSFDEARDEFTRGYLEQLLRVTRGNVTQAARLAKRNRTDFYKLLARHGISTEDFKG